MSIRVMEEGPDLAAPIEGRGEKLGSARAEDLVGSRAVRNPNAQFADDALVVGRRRIAHGRLVFCGTKRRRQENLAPCKTQKAEGPGKLMHYCRSQHIAIERQRASVVADHQEASEFHPIYREVIGECSIFFHRSCSFQAELATARKAAKSTMIRTTSAPFVLPSEKRSMFMM